MDIVNIIMASYNGERYLREQIDSIIQNSYTNWRLTVFDDGSTDSTCEIVLEYATRYPNKIYLVNNKQNLGVTKNFLVGVNSAKVDIADNNYYMFCDQDDVWMPNKIHKTLKAMKKAEQKDSTLPIAVFTDNMVVDERLNPLKPSFFKTSGLDPYKTKLNYLLMENKLIGCTVMFNQKLKEKLTQFPSSIRFHDWWVGLIAAAFGRIYFLNEATLYYRQHGNNVVGNKDFVDYVKKSILSITKQKEVIKQTIRQGNDFYELYKNELPKNKEEVLYEFTNLGSYGLLHKRMVIMKYRFLKTGLIRNIGLLLLI